MKVHEYQARELLVEAGVPVPPSFVVESVDEAVSAAEKIGRRTIALLEECGRQFGCVAVAHHDVDAGVVLELLDERIDQALAAPRVDDEGAGFLAAVRRRFSVRRRCC